MADYITVQSTKTDQRVCLHEFDAAHPDGEVFIVNDGKPYTVALTAGIAQRLQSGALVEVQHKSKKSAEPATESTAPFEGYDEMNANTILERFATMSDEEKESLKAYEAAHKNRKGIIEA